MTAIGRLKLEVVLQLGGGGRTTVVGLEDGLLKVSVKENAPAYEDRYDAAQFRSMLGLTPLLDGLAVPADSEAGPRTTHRP